MGCKFFRFCKCCKFWLARGWTLFATEQFILFKVSLNSLLGHFQWGEHDLPHSTEYSSRSPSWRRWRRRAVARWTRWLARWKLGCGAIEMEPWWTEWKIPKAADNDKNKRNVRKKNEKDSQIAKNRVSHKFVKVQAPKTLFYLNQPGQKIDLCSEHICFPPSDSLSFVNSFRMLVDSKMIFISLIMKPDTGVFLKTKILQ